MVFHFQGPVGSLKSLCLFRFLRAFPVQGTGNFTAVFPGPGVFGEILLF